MLQAPLCWDVYGRVIDNFGDVGVCWRLARDLATRGHTVRLFLDDASALAWMAPQGAPGVTVHTWPQAHTPVDRPGDVVIEAFGCDLPPAVLQAMAQRTPAPAWINLEYLSAESYVERSHGLRSPQFSGPAAGLNKWFFYPGFTERTGGLLREPGLADAQAAFDAPAWRAQQGIHAQPQERIVTLFCYDNPALPDLLDGLAQTPTLLLATPGAASTQVQALLGPTLRRDALRAQLLPHVSQPDFDHLLWASDLNCVRGEDSFVRAQWAGKPMLWQIYPQHDGAHGPKLNAFLDLYLASAKPPLALGPCQALWQAWNGLKPWPLPPIELWTTLENTRPQALAWQAKLQTQTDLTTQLLRFLAKTG